MSAWRRTAVAVGTIGAAAGIAVVGNRLAANRLRARPDADAGDDLSIAPERTHRLPAHDGGEIFVVEAGTGPPIVLSHGVTLSLRTWAKQFQQLPGRGFRVIAFDHRGHGESTLGTAGHGVEQLAHDVRSVLERLDLRDAVLVGHSMGGIAVQSFCIHHPDIARERVAGIVLLSSLARSPLGANPRVTKMVTQVVNRLPDGAAALRARDLGLAIARIGFGRDPQPSHVEATRRMILGTSRETRRDAVLALAGLDFTSQLSGIDRPTLVIGGTADVLAPIAESRRMARRIPGARLEEVRGGGHMLMLERAELIDDLIVEFAHGTQGSGGFERVHEAYGK